MVHLFPEQKEHKTSELLRRRQAVSQQVLVLPFVGSNPAASTYISAWQSQLFTVIHSDQVIQAVALLSFALKPAHAKLCA